MRAARTLRLAHGLPATHPVHNAMLNFASLVEERTGGEITIMAYADGLLGQEPDLVDQLKAGRLDFAKASASILDGLNSRYQVFNVPFLIRDRSHWRRLVMGPIGASILGTPEDPVFGLTFYDAGARSFYGRGSILRPDDLRGLKIRVQPSPTTVQMVELLGAQPVPMPWALVYSALQTRLVDGAENNLTALIYGRHAEVVRHYSYTEHTFVPDVLLMSGQTWKSLSQRHQSIIRNAAQESALLQEVLWEEAEAESRQRSREFGVEFELPDKKAFADQLKPIKNDFANRLGLGEMIERIEGA